MASHYPKDNTCRFTIAGAAAMRDGLPGIASEEAKSKVRLLGNAHRLSPTDLGDLALARGLRLRLLFKLLGLGRDELGKGVAHLRLGADVRGAGAAAIWVAAAGETIVGKLVS